MGVFKNEVGRPSNETIKKRNIFKGICFILVVIILLLVAYIVNDKLGSKDDNKPNTNKTTTKRSVETFDKSQIVTKKHDDDNFVDVYVYGKKVFSDVETDILRIEVIEDVAVIEVNGIDVPQLLIVNTKGEELYGSSEGGFLLYCPKEKTSECYDFKVSGNKIRFYRDGLG